MGDINYQGNARKDKVPTEPKKKLEKVVTSDVVVQKKGLGRKIRDLFIEADIRTVLRYVATDVMLPAARNMIVDASARGVERLMYGEAAVRRRGYGGYGGGPHTTYNRPVDRGYGSSPLRNAPPITVGSRSVPSSQSREDIILSSREEAERVLEVLNEVIDQYDVASVADLNDLLGLPQSHTDQKWGWVFLKDVEVRQIREGYLIELPRPEPIQ